MPTTDLAFLLFPLAALALFMRFAPAVAALATCLGGWLLLPVATLGGPAPDGAFAYWIIGQALPSDALLAKAWVAPVTALVGLAAFAPRLWRTWRPVWPDAAVLLWCAWPLAQAAVGLAGDPPAALASLYLAGSWGAPWLVGRLCCAGAGGGRRLLQALALAGLACLPFALVEAVQGAVFHAALYAPHPFAFDGTERYLGHRPIGFFEHGNQYGLWVALSALAAVWLARATPAGGARRGWLTAAAVLVAMTLAAQSVGAIVLLGIGIAALQACRWASPRRMTIGAVALAALAGGIYLSGVVPLQHIATETRLGRKAVDVIRATGRGSLTWRVSQDQKMLRPAFAKPLTGSAHWDWWRPEQRRPWGLPLMLAGQFGVVGLLSCFGLLLWPAASAGLAHARGSAWATSALPLALATIVLLALGDMLLNTFIFFPALLCAGALATPSAAAD